MKALLREKSLRDTFLEFLMLDIRIEATVVEGLVEEEPAGGVEVQWSLGARPTECEMAEEQGAMRRRGAEWIHCRLAQDG